jgi:cyclopropane fatty-acyl-phospholipid synthase-like methyltransferase
MAEKSSSSYNQIAEQWGEARKEGFFEPKYIDLLLKHMADGVNILDVGCGTGVPIAQYLISQGLMVTGLDVSEAMLEIAKQKVPEACFILCDLMKFETTVQYSGIIAWDSIFHIPREHHLSVFRQLHDWLLPNGMLLISLGGSAWEGTIEMFGHDFFCSGFEPDNSLELLQEAGFEILLSEVDDPRSRGHIAVLCRRRSLEIAV